MRKMVVKRIANYFSGNNEMSNRVEKVRERGKRTGQEVGGRKQVCSYYVSGD